VVVESPTLGHAASRGEVGSPSPRLEEIQAALPAAVRPIHALRGARAQAAAPGARGEFGSFGYNRNRTEGTEPEVSRFLVLTGTERFLFFINRTSPGTEEPNRSVRF